MDVSFIHLVLLVYAVGSTTVLLYSTSSMRQCPFYYGKCVESLICLHLPKQEEEEKEDGKSGLFYTYIESRGQWDPVKKVLSLLPKRGIGGKDYKKVSGIMYCATMWGSV